MPNTSKLGAYIAPTHDPAKWQDYLRAINPPLVRILMPGTAPTSIVSQVHAICPDALISLRWWDVDDGGEGNKMPKLASVNNAHEAAVRDYDTYLQRYTAMNKEASQQGLPFPKSFQVFFNTINEPPSWQHDKRDAISEYCRAMLLYGETAGGPNIMVGEFAVGHPEEWPPVWDWFEGVIDVMDERDILTLHEYWQPEGPLYAESPDKQDWGALAGRYTHCPFDVPIAITECGVDGRIYNRYQPPHTGWLKFMSAEQYAGQMGSYLAQLKKDKRIIGCTPFLEDFADKQWASFDTHPAKDYFVRVLEAMDVPAEQQQPSVYIPSVSTGSKPVPPTVPAGGLDSHVLMAILKVESGGEDDLADGLKIRFEPHIFAGYVGEGKAREWFDWTPGNYTDGEYLKDGEWKRIHASQDNEQEALQIAMNMNQEAAFDSTSMGMSQVMGFNAERVGWPSAASMFEDFSQDTTYHLIAFYNYLLSDGVLLQAVKDKDWATIAERYNGTGNVEYYAKRLQEEYGKL